MKVITRDRSNYKGKKYIYFCAHPEDHPQYYKEFSEDIFRYVNCAIWSEEDPSCIEGTEEGRENFYRCMDLAVVPVTRNLFVEDHDVRDRVLPSLMRLGVPILPIITEDGLYDAANAFFDNRQVLDVFHNDDTALGYYDKLERFLTSVLMPSSHMDKIKEAFQEHLFISYRKVDRAIALALIDRIHTAKELRNLGIWYDEFLTPTEDFDDEIKENIVDCHSVVLLITPNTLAEGNYIITDEYPFSKENDKNIVAILMPEVSKEEVYDTFPKVDVCIEWDAVDFTKQLIDALGFCDKEEYTPEEFFFLGSGYLNGVGVERNYTYAKEYLSAAAEEGYALAADTMAHIYKWGMGVVVDIKEEIRWREMYKNLSIIEYVKNPSEDLIKQVIKAGSYVADCLRRDNQWDAADYQYEETISFLLELPDRNRWLPEIANMCINYGVKELNCGHYDRAAKILARAERCYDELAEIDPDACGKYDYEFALLNLNQGTVCLKQEKYDQGMEYLWTAVNILQELVQDNPEEYSVALIKAAGNLGSIYQRQGMQSGNKEDLEYAQHLLSQTAQLSEEMLSTKPDVYEPLMATSYQMLGEFCLYIRQNEKAEEALQKAINVHHQMYEAGKTHYKADVASCYQDYGVLLREEKNLEQAVKYVHAATAIYRELFIQSKEMYGLRYAKGLDLLGELHQMMGQEERATELFQWSHAVYNSINS